MGYEAVALQGNMSQGQRDRAMAGFRAGRFEVLVATDVAARGIDVAQVSHVINFDMPTTPTAYTHRIGRTGRGERGGKAYTFVCTEDLAAVKALERQLGKAISRRQVPGFDAGPIEATQARPAGPGHDDPSRSDRSKHKPRNGWKGRARRRSRRHAKGTVTSSSHAAS